jgi:hypothetical protein
MIPIIIISSLTGVANFSQTSMSEQYIKISSSIIGGFNIIAAVLTSIVQFLGISEKKESHRHSTKAWQKFLRNVNFEIKRNPKERTSKLKFFEIVKNEYDRLTESDATIPKHYLIQFKHMYGALDNYNLPEICGKIRPTLLYSENKSSKKEVDLPKLEINNEV